MKCRSALIPLLFAVGSVCAISAISAISPASAAIGGVDGPDCVRLWTHALDPNEHPKPGSLYAIMRQVRERAPPWIRQQNKVDFMATSCRIDRALAKVIIEDEIGMSLDESKPELAPALHDQDPISPNTATLIKRWRQENEQCRGGHGDDPRTDAACAARMTYDAKLSAIGWCYGDQGEFEYQKTWHKCGPHSIRDDADGYRVNPSGNTTKIVCRNRYRVGNNMNGSGDVYYGCEPRP
jgi:hypothetical protein